MTMRNAVLSNLAVLIMLGAAAGEDPVKFAAKPAATKSSDGVKIEFTASRETDAIVAIQDSQGKVIRHLAGGVLNKTAPEPFQAGSLKQSVVWDGKDDFGKPATGGGFKASVQLGMKPAFDSFVMYNPDACGRIDALAIGPGGNVYMFNADSVANGNMGGHKIKVFSRDGKEIKALTPFPADIAPSKIKALGVFQTPEGDLVPRMYNWEQLSYYPDANGVRGRDMPTYSCPAVDSKGRVYWIVHGPSLCAVDADCGIPYDTFLGPRMLGDIKNLRMAAELGYNWDVPNLAVSSDDKFIYFAGLSTGADDFRSFQPIPCVFRVDVEKRGPGEIFLGKPGQPGKEKELLTAPRGLAVAKGLLYVADPRGDRIVAFKESDRSYAGEVAIKNPQSIGVDPATGAIYACVYTGDQTADLVKLSGLQGKELCRLALPRTINAPNFGVHRIAVDTSAKPVRIWMPSLGDDCKLYCYEESGDKFIDKGDPRSKELFAAGARDLSVDHVRNELYIKANTSFYRVDDQTGKVKDTLAMDTPQRAMAYGLQIVPGSDGNFYGDVFGDIGAAGSGLWRFDRKGTTLDWDGQKTANFPIGGMMSFQARHLALKPFAPPEELYYIPPANYIDKNERSKFTSLNAFGTDGKTRRTLIWQLTHGAVPRFDAKGNIYIADLVKPPNRSYPEFFDGKLEPPPKQCIKDPPFWTSFIYGSIIKFPPSGGIIWYQKELSKSCIGSPPSELLAKPKQPFMTMFECCPYRTGEIQGALWTRFGFAPYACGVCASCSTIHCGCEAAGFDVDPYGRVFYPNLGEFRVEVVDTNNNWIGTFGKYGNEDSGGPNAKVKKPEIPLAWPTYVAVSDNYAYVNDSVSRRVVRVKLNYAAEATCALP
jgi:hypothetical protein